jgi:hydrogenase maturation factor HypF (carbamoyltransferase family)
METTLGHLKKKGFNVLRPMQYSPNDESLSLGQIAFALNRLKKKTDD